MSIDPLAGNPDHIQGLCSRLDIGKPQGDVTRVYGGFHHQMWRLQTDLGSYAVKQLAADTDLRCSGLNNHFNVTESIAESFARHGISAIVAVKGKRSYLQRIDHIGYLVYPWTKATALGVHDITEKHVLDVARVMAAMHCANIAAPGLEPVPFDVHPEDKIIYLVKKAGQCGMPNRNTLKEQVPAFLSIVAAHSAAVQVLDKRMVVSHGDLDHKNVLWDASGHPIIIDWESARQLNPGYEVLLEGLDWGGITLSFDHGLFESFLSSYVQAGGIIDSASIQACFDCILGDWLNWLMYNVGRCLELEGPEQHLLLTKQVDLSLATIFRLSRLMPRLIAIAGRFAT